MALNLDSIPKIDLCLLPTPIVSLNRLSDYLGGPRIFMKRDDLTCVAFGGNKNRKLEYLLADALQRNADVIITEGAVNSNHCLQTASCSARLGIDCELVLSGEEPEEITGNYFLFKVLGVTIHRVKDAPERKDCLNEREKELVTQGNIPYVIPAGGSNALGAFGYINCISEVVTQAQQMNIKFSYFVHAAGSSGTQAGMLLGKKLFDSQIEILSINCGEDPKYLANETIKILNEFNSIHNLEHDLREFSTEVITGYEGPGYGLASQEMIDAVKLVAQLEGVFLDPVYNGKAMVGLIDMIRTKSFSKDDKILFLNSGGGPTLFNYSKSFFSEISNQENE